MKSQKGFSLIEVLVTLLITSVGLLGLAALQVKSLQFNHGAYLRSQANILAYDIADRMRLNKDDARAGDYNILMTASKPSASGLVTTDQNQWLTLVETTLPAGDGSVSCVSNICTLTIQWREAGRRTDENFDSFTYKTQI
jgi:type IV pilus assembly protein PilV